MRNFLTFLSIFLCLILLTGSSGSESVDTSRLQPALAKAAVNSPGKVIRVLVQASGGLHELARQLENLGGHVVRELRILNSLAVEMPAGVALELPHYASVNWAALDAPVGFSQTQIEYVRDNFDTTSYTNNDGAMDWAAGWVETGDDGGPYGGDITVEGGGCPSYYNRCIEFDSDAGQDSSLTRQVDLRGADWATLSFDYRLDGSYTDYAIEASGDGGATWGTLKVYRWSSSGSPSFSLDKYISDQTQIRFRLLQSNSWKRNHLFIDNVRIEVGVKENTYLQTLGADQLHAEGITGQGVTVAVIDSGVASHPDLSGRLIDPAAFGTSGDVYGHGTHVAGIIAGNGSTLFGAYEGIAPGAQIISLGVSDSSGMAYESDVVYALEWVLANKDQYNIRVVNLSLNSTVEGSYHESGIDAAIEILWFNGVVVVASAGNKGPAGGHNTAKTAPANDPFIITVGATDEKGDAARGGDTVASFSSFGTTTDGFFRPDILAPGTNIFSALCANCAWAAEYPARVSLLGEYFRLSGTSMAAPMVSGTAALLLSDEPGLTPDQVKYRLLSAGSTVVDSSGNVFPYLDAYAAVQGTTTQAANQGNITPHMLLAKMAMMAYWASANSGGTIDWSNIDWSVVNWDNVDWDNVDWASVNWNSVNWNSVNWNSVNWNSVNWNSVNWNSVNWNSVNWNSVNWNSAKLDGVFWGPGGGNGNGNGNGGS